MTNRQASSKVVNEATGRMAIRVELPPELEVEVTRQAATQGRTIEDIAAFSGSKAHGRPAGFL